MNLTREDMSLLKKVHKAVSGANNDGPLKDYIDEPDIISALELLLLSYEEIDYLKEHAPVSKYERLIESLYKVEEKARDEFPEWCGSVARLAAATIMQLDKENIELNKAHLRGILENELKN